MQTATATAATTAPPTKTPPAGVKIPQIDTTEAEKALIAKIDEHGEFKMKDDKTLEYEAFSDMKAMTLESSLNAINKQKNAIRKRRLEIFKAQNQQEYVNCWREEVGLTVGTLGKLTQKACEHVGITKEVWEASVKEHLNDQRKATEIRIRENEIRKTFINQKVTLDYNATMNALKAKITRDFAMKEKM